MTAAILQFGTSRFLQAHVDLFVSAALARNEAAGAVAVVQTTDSPDSRRRIEGFRALHPYPVLIRGIEHGVKVDRRVEVRSVVEAWHASDDAASVAAHVAREARYVVCNTADRGWQLDGSDSLETPRSFPARLVAWLRLRFRAGGAPLTLLPCELISANGTTLRGIATAFARAHGAEPGFVEWLHEGCIWGNSLVDRIVSEALEPVGAVAEPYALWAIEAQPGLASPCVHPDVRVVADLLPYERRKLFILNLGHTVLAERWLAERRPEDETVAQTMDDPAARRLLDAVLTDEVLPVFATLGTPAEAYRDSVLERFANPFLRHRLADIAGNHAAKKQRRIVALCELAGVHGVATPALSRIALSGLG